jgi:hypothetical protein
MRVTPSFFRVLPVPPLLGRTFTEEEGEVGSDLKVVLSYGLWQSAFGGDATIVGRDVRLDGQPFTVVGVMRREFVYRRPDVMLWRALAFTPQQKSYDMRHSNNFQQIGRLKPGATIGGVRTLRTTSTTGSPNARHARRRRSSYLGAAVVQHEKAVRVLSNAPHLLATVVHGLEDVTYVLNPASSSSTSTTGVTRMASQS